MLFPLACISMVITELWRYLSCVNSYHLIMECTMLSISQKGVVTNCNAFFITWVLIFASIFKFVSKKTYLRSSIPNSGQSVQDHYNVFAYLINYLYFYYYHLSIKLYMHSFNCMLLDFYEKHQVNHIHVIWFYSNISLKYINYV